MIQRLVDTTISINRVSKRPNLPKFSRVLTRCICVLCFTPRCCLGLLTVPGSWGRRGAVSSWPGPKAKGLGTQAHSRAQRRSARPSVTRDLSCSRTPAVQLIRASWLAVPGPVARTATGQDSISWGDQHRRPGKRGSCCFFFFFFLFLVQKKKKLGK